MSEDIKINESAILETLNAKIDYDGGNYKGSGLANYVVDKSGDTLTGGLVFDTRTGAHVIQMRNTNYDWTNNKAEQQYPGVIVFGDKNGDVARIDVYTPNDTLQTARIGTRNIATGIWAFLNVSVDNSGNTYCEFPKCTTKATTTSSASSSKVAVVVQNYVNGTSWYRVWSDGWIEQGGYLIMTATVTTLTFLKSFTNANYTLVGTKGRGNTTNSRVVNLSNLTAKTVDVSIPYNNGLATDYNVNWYACGY
jgi:hypothetical protein